MEKTKNLNKQKRVNKTWFFYVKKKEDYKKTEKKVHETVKNNNVEK